MATYTTLQNGSSGSEVKKLQQALINAGYSVGSTGADGIYGSNTAAAVKAYQKANGLSADGIAGNQTLSKLYSTSTASTSTTTTTPKDTSFKYEDFVYTDIKDSDTVKQAEALLQEHMANKPGNYSSNWQTQLNETLDKILNREKFSYDLNGDVLYQQYKDQYTTQGKQAMMDTMGQAQAATGGYGNSYAQTVGQQTYQGYLQQLNDKVPELYQLALNQYNQEGQDLYNQYGLYADREEQEYGRYRDTVSDYYTELSQLTDSTNTAYNRELAEREFAYTQYSDKNSVQYQLQQDAYEHAMNMIGLGVMPSSDKLASAGISSADAQTMVNKVLANEKKTVNSSTTTTTTPKKTVEETPKTPSNGFTGKSYSEAVAYLKSKGVDGATAAGIYTMSEWSSRRNSKNNIAAQFKTYQEYLAYITEYHTTQ